MRWERWRLPSLRGVNRRESAMMVMVEDIVRKGMEGH